MDESAFAIQRRLVCSFQKKLWLPSEKQVNGVSFVKLEKWDRSLVKLLTGNSLDLRKSRAGGSLASDPWDELVQARQDTANRLLTEAKTSSAEGDAQPPSKKVKQVKATPKQMILLPEVVHVMVRGRRLAMLLDGLGTQKLWLEATADNLQWLQATLEGAKVKEKKSGTSGSMPKKKRKTTAQEESSNSGDGQDESE